MTLPSPGAQAGYRRALQVTGQTLTFRRVTGNAPNATVADFQVTAIFRHYTPTSPIGPAVHTAAISEGDRQFIVLQSDIEDAGFPVPLQKNDKIIVGVETFNIVDVDYGTRVFAGAIEGRAVGV